MWLKGDSKMWNCIPGQRSLKIIPCRAERPYIEICGSERFPPSPAVSHSLTSNTTALKRPWPMCTLEIGMHRVWEFGMNAGTHHKRRNGWNENGHAALVGPQAFKFSRSGFDAVIQIDLALLQTQNDHHRYHYHHCITPLYDQAEALRQLAGSPHEIGMGKVGQDNLRLKNNKLTSLPDILGTARIKMVRVLKEMVRLGLTLSLPRVINVKFLLQLHQKYYITEYGELGSQESSMSNFSCSLTRNITSHSIGELGFS